jgi:hypothetical protein
MNVVTGKKAAGSGAQRLYHHPQTRRYNQRRIMRTLLIPLVLACSACDQKSVETFTFRESLKYTLSKKCGEDEQCKTAVKEQIESCMESSDWETFLHNQDDEKEKSRFLTEFYGCLKDNDGNPLFRVREQEAANE